MIEAEVVEAFAVWLASEGWVARTEVDQVDIVAERDGVTLLVEVKGCTSSAGLDVDTAYGQLLRRMRPGVDNQRYALVVPSSVRKAAERVRPEIRANLKIDLYVVADDGAVEIV